MNGMNKLKKFLEKRGYKFYKNIFHNNLCDWYAYKCTESKRECTSNETPVQVVVTPHIAKYNSTICKSVEVDLTAEFNGVWWKLKAYSLSEKDVIKNLEMIEMSLVKAWEAL